ncbi:GATOR complex protein Iml1-like isoform X1 [Argonauta hians]
MIATKKMRTKLYLHERNFKEYDLLINSKDFPGINQGDVLEIYNPQVNYSRLLLQVNTFTEDLQYKECISVESSIAGAFHLKPFNDVYVNKVDPTEVCLDLVELLYKEQYYSRSDMWRMRKKLVNTCAYLNKKIEFAEMRCQVSELWSKGEHVTCGVIDDNTRIVFRSSTAVVQIFIQMSSEMWDFDVHGDLYFEKAVNGFLTDLFAKWKEQNCCHDVTIVLFSRTFYNASSRDEFPQSIREWIQQDYKGRFYEDFYRVVVQNERFEDWSGTLIQLRVIFNEYPQKVVRYHEACQLTMPSAENSTASQGNFLETLNMSLNLFERYYLDRSFDRTGQVAVVITPGPGVFEVDRELTNITKHRTIDCGIGSDLVCMGEQPLHAAPLFKFHSKTEKITLEVGDDYNIPHWMNHSFYTFKSPLVGSESTFIPRIKPPKIPGHLPHGGNCASVLEDIKMKSKDDVYSSSYYSDNDFTFIDYDGYDAQVFKFPSRGIPRTSKCSAQFSSLRKKPTTVAEVKKNRKPRTRYISDDFSGLFTENTPKSTATSPAISIPIQNQTEIGSPIVSYPLTDRSNVHDFIGLAESDDCTITRPIVGSAGSPVGHSKNYHHRPRKALINPFAPSRMRFKMTSNRRRWVHAFPTDPSGAAVQTHHTSQQLQNSTEESDSSDVALRTDTLSQSCNEKKIPLRPRSDHVSLPSSVKSSRVGCILGNSYPDDQLPYSKSNSPSHHFGWAMTNSGLSQSNDQPKYLSRREPYRTYMWGVTGEQEWSPEMTTGWDWRPLNQQETSRASSHLIKQILTADYNTQHFCAGISVDWKSLTIPASLPITTDFFPDLRSLNADFVVYNYIILPEIVNSEYWSNLPSNPDEKCYRKPPMDTEQLFRELISQRLSQGFQLIVLPKNLSDSLSITRHRGAGFYRSLHNKNDDSEICYLSIGRVYHKMTRVDKTVIVTRYMPRHPYRLMHYKYRYRFQAPDSDHYSLSGTEFTNEKLENYNWNYLDHFICTQGEGDYPLTKILKYWRSRFFLLPYSNSTRKISEAGAEPKCDIYEDSSTNFLIFINGFIRFAESLNKIKRTQHNRRNTKASNPLVQSASITAAAAAQNAAAAAAAAAASSSSSSGAGGATSSVITSAGESSAPLAAGSNPNVDSCLTNQERVSADSCPTKILQAMLDPKTGIPFLSKHEGLQNNCFISAEAATWCSRWLPNIESLEQAIALLQSFVDKQLICHSSGNIHHEFVFGFLFYFIVNKDGEAASSSISYNPLFQNEWLEVSIANDQLKAPSYPAYTLPSGNTDSNDDGNNKGYNKKIKREIYKYCNVDVDPTKKSDRVEWARAKYSSGFHSKCAFELEVQWMVASGPVFGELIYAWSRKTQNGGFHLLPVPLDPFALPLWPQSDPLRGPFTIKMDLSCVECLSSGCIEGKDLNETSKIILKFQSAVVRRFGFLNVLVQNDDNQSPWYSIEADQYIHCSGGMFIILSTIDNLCKLGTKQRTSSRSSPQISEAAINYINHSGDLRHEQNSLSAHFPILWSWNHMLSKRWRTAFTGDELFQDKLLLDFRKFCNNSENRLLNFWNEFYSASSSEVT